MQKVNIESDEFKSVSESSLMFRNKNGINVEITPEQRSTQTNVFLYLTVIFLNDSGIEPDIDTLINNSIEVFNDIINIFAFRGLKSLNENTDNFDMGKFDEYKQEKNFQNMLETYFENISNGIETEIPFHNTISKYYLGIMVGNNSFEKTLQKFIIAQEKEELYEGLTLMDRYVFISPLSTSGMKIWKVKDTRVNKDAAIKMFPIEMFNYINNLDKLVNDGNVIKIIELLKEYMLEYRNWFMLKSFSNKTSFMTVGYSTKLKMAFIVTELFEGSLDKVKFSSNIEAIQKIFVYLNEIHMLGFTYNNLDLSHLMVKNGDIYFIGFRKLVEFGKNLESIDVNYNGTYGSLNLIQNGLLYPYDDIESLLYISNDLYTDSKVKFNDIYDEIDKKTTLSIFMANIKNAIEQVRRNRYNDIYVATNKPIDDIKNYVNLLYDETYENEITHEKLIGFNEIFVENIMDISEVTVIPADLHPSEEAMVKKIKMYMHYSTNIQSSDEMALKIMNVIMNGVTYEPQDQFLIDSFLREKFN